MLSHTKILYIRNHASAEKLCIVGHQLLMRIFTDEDVVLHDNVHSCWVTRHGNVYNVTGFLADHPGGDDLLLRYAGKDVEEIMRDIGEHDHSESAYAMLDEFQIGVIGTDAEIVKDGEFCYFLVFRGVEY